MAQGRKLGTMAPGQRIEVTIMLRRRPGGDVGETLSAHLANGLRQHQAPLTDAAFAERFGADPHDIVQVEAFAHASGFDIVDSRPAERRVILAGTVAACSDAFGVTLDAYVDADDARIHRCRSGAVHVPAALAGIVEGVFGLDDRPQAKPHFRLQPVPQAGVMARVASTSYTPLQLAAAYDFPTAGKGTGQCIAIIELGGGYKASELDAYFTGLGLTPPTIKSRSIDGGRNRPDGNPNSADGEVLLDIEVVGAIAPGATIVVYFAPNTDAGFLNAISSAVHDPHNRPAVISISWGGPELSWTAQAMRAMDAVFQDAAALGVTVCCAAGDDGSSDQRAPAADDGALHADFPASSPFVLACGGTRLDAAGGEPRGSVWNQGCSGGATGGGVSDVFARPPWQDGAGVPASANPGKHVGRGVPDVAANTDPATGYLIQVDRQHIIMGGTSAVAPLYAALIALCNEQLGRRLGYLNPVLYGLPASARAFRDIRSGDNDISLHHSAYPASTGWDPCSGLGSVDGSNLLAALRAL